jgi:hypothetical protein
MIEEFQEKQRRQGSRARSILDYTMGVIFLLFGLYFLLHKVLGAKNLSFDSSTLYFLGVLFVVYGCWRIYRGYKKNYYR